MKTENNTFEMAKTIESLAFGTTMTNLGTAMTIEAIYALQSAGYTTVQSGQATKTAIKSHELNYEIMKASAVLGFKQAGLVYDDAKRLQFALANFRMSLVYALECGNWHTNVSRAKAAKAAADKAAADKGTNNKADKADKGANKRVDKAFDAFKVIESLMKSWEGKFTQKEYDALIEQFKKVNK